MKLMAIIKATRPDGGNITCVQPDERTAATVQELKDKGHTEIHDAETGQSY